MNLILFHRHEIASSTCEMVDLDTVDLDPTVAAAGTAAPLSTTSNSEDNNKDHPKNVNGGNKQKTTNYNVDTTSCTHRPMASASSSASSGPSSPPSGRFRMDLCPDLVTSHDARIVHLTHHLHKRPGDSFRIGIIGGNQGRATIIMVDQTTTEATPTTTSITTCNNTNSDNDNQQHKKRSRKEMRSHSPLDFFLLLDFDPTLPTSSLSHQQQQQQLPEITLLLSMPFPKRLKYLWSQISAFGCVHRICIVRGTLSDTNFCQSSVLNPTMYRPLIEEGLCQGCHTRDIQVDICVHNVLSQSVLEQLGLAASSTTTAMIENDDNSTASGKTPAAVPAKKLAKVVLDCGDEEGNNNNNNNNNGDNVVTKSTNRLPLPLRDGVLQQLHGYGTGVGVSDADDATVSHHCVVAVGSERGWTEDEAQLFSYNGFQATTLGSSILRVDTAVVCALGIVTATLDSLRSGTD